MRNIELPNEIFGKPVKGAIERALASQPKQEQEPQPTSKNAPNLDGFIYIPSLRLYVQKEKQLHGKEWNESHEELQKQSLRMPTIEQFRQFLIYLKQNPNQENTNIYNEITQVRNPWRAEWLDAKFEQIGKDILINYNHVVQGNNLVPGKKEKLSGHLAKNKLPGISLEKWLKDATPQGLPKSGIEDGSLYYWAPVPGYVARFDAGSGWAGLY